MAAVSWLAVSRSGLLDGQNPGCKLFGFRVADLGVGRHGNGTPNASATFLNFGGQFVDGCFIACIFGSDIFETRPNEFFVIGMACHAVF